MRILKTSKARENILAKIRKGLSEHSIPMPFPEVDKENVAEAFGKDELSAEETFAEAFIKLGGKFVFCSNEMEFIENIHILYENNGWEQLLCAEPRLLNLFRNNKLDIAEDADAVPEGADACITTCEVLVARTGSIILSSRQHLGRTTPVFYPIHLVVAYADQIVPDIQQGLDLMKKKYGAEMPSMINLNTGPSRTADIEKTLVVGVHGPAEIYCFYINA